MKMSSHGLDNLDISLFGHTLQILDYSQVSSKVATSIYCPFAYLLKIAHTPLTLKLLGQNVTHGSK